MRGEYNNIDEKKVGKAISSNNLGIDEELKQSITSSME
jgi:hypothetical protein